MLCSYYYAWQFDNAFRSRNSCHALFVYKETVSFMNEIIKLFNIKNLNGVLLIKLNNNKKMFELSCAILLYTYIWGLTVEGPMSNLYIALEWRFYNRFLGEKTVQTIVWLLN